MSCGVKLLSSCVRAGSVAALSQASELTSYEVACTLLVLVTGYFVVLFTAKIAFVLFSFVPSSLSIVPYP